MKKLLPAIFSLLSIHCFAQYTLTITSGYGSGTFAAGDTVHIWSSAIPANNVFDKWTGDVSFLESNDEWHTTLIMPAQNVSVTANFRNIGSYTINHESIRGRDTLKEVYSYFPPNFKGVIFCFHGTGGNATNWTTLHEYKQFLSDAVADTFAFIITEAEETSTQTDYNLNGKLQWNYLPYDSTNIDFANIEALIDTFTQRGLLNSGTKYYAVGMSNGGAFSSTIATFFNWRAAVSYCAPASQLLASTTTVPIQWCMAKYDNHPNVGAQGNADALSNHNTMAGRGICTKYFSNDHSPVYPERFMRSGTISQTKASNLFTEFQNNNLLDADNYLLYASDSIASRIAATPSAFLQFLTLPTADKIFVSTQVDAMYSAHQFYSDYNKKTLRFFNSLCDTAGIPAAIDERVPDNFSLRLFPDPVTDVLHVTSVNELVGEEFSIVDLNGRVVYKGIISLPEFSLSTATLAPGVYFLKTRVGGKKFIRQ